MKLPHAAGADAAKGPGVLGDMQQGVVDRDAAGPGGVQDRVGSTPVPVEQVEGKGGVPGGDIGDGLVQGAIGNQGQSGPKISSRISERFSGTPSSAVGGKRRLSGSGWAPGPRGSTRAPAARASSRAPVSRRK